ncbi:MAG: hypothetical protein RIR18_1329, partial [Pseudomonadota bacterium]
MSNVLKRLASLLVIGISVQAHAAEWSDTAIGWSHGTQFSEPYNSQKISKNIFSVTYANGYAYGQNFLNADFLFSDHKDPACFTCDDGAREAYVVYRHTLDIGKLRGVDMSAGPLKGLGLTLGFDWNTKEDAGYNSKKRMLVAGPTLMIDVPGYLNISLLMLLESNQPTASSGAYNPGYPSSRYDYDPHAMLSLAWGLPLSEQWA